MKKTMTFEVKEIGAPEDRTLRFIGSTETVDRDNDIIEVNGWNLGNYLKNPVFLWCHDYRQPPIGKAVNVVKDINNKVLSFDIKFATAEEYAFADTIYRLYKGGFMTATSVGFKPTKYKRRDDDAVLDKPEWQRGTRFVEQELLELSAVPVPSNPEALLQARSKGIKTEEVEKFISPVEVDIQKGIVSIRDENGETRSFSFDFLLSVDKKSLDDYTQWKAGATLSKKNKEALTQAVGLIKGVLDAAEPQQDLNEGGEEEDEQGDKSVDVNEIAKQVAEILKSMPPAAKTEEDEIDLDSIEIPKSEGELDIDPAALKDLLSSVIKEELDKARGKIS